MERYQRIYLDDNKLYVREAGIVICAQAILKDNKINKVIAQVKFQNTLDKEVVALFVNVDCYDITEKKLDSVTNYQFLDLKEKRDSYFGSKTAIALPDNNTRRISVSVQKLVYDDGTVWEKGRTEDYMLLTEPEVISKDKEVCKQAQLEFGSAAQYKYQKYEEVWRCSCGAINHNNERNCHSCGLGEDKLIATSLEALVERKNHRVAEETRIAQEEEKARQILEEEQRKKNKKIALIALGVGLIALTIFIIIATKPARTIARAEKYAEEGEYVLALKELKDLNMPEETQETYYEISNLFKGEIDKAIDNKEINKAISLLESYPELDGYDELYKSVRNACPHEKKKTDSKKVTCTENGYENQICKVCGKIFDEKVIEALGHDYKAETIKEATCTKKGLENSVCQNCGDKVEKEIALLPHSYIDKITKEATCTEKGKKTSTCKVCNYVENKSISALGHSYEKTTTKNATCAEKGQTTFKCKRCNDSYSESIAKTEHNWKAATCTESSRCVHCGLTGDPALGHNWNYWYDQVVYCDRCSAKHPTNFTITYKGEDLLFVDVTSVNYVDATPIGLFQKAICKIKLRVNGYSEDYLNSGWVYLYDSSGEEVGKTHISFPKGEFSIDCEVQVFCTSGNFSAKVGY